MTHDDRLKHLEESLAAQQAEIERLRSELASAPRRSAGTASETSPETRVRSSRRMMLKGGAVAAGAAIAGAMIRPDTAAAADGDNMVIGGNNTSANGNTRLRTPDPGALLSNQNILTVSDDATSSSYEAAIGAVAQGDRVTNGVYSFVSTRVDGDTSTGHSVVARKTSSGRSNIYMPPSGVAPPIDTYAHTRGELRADSSGILWYCVDSGTPGTWRRIAGSGSAGAVHAISPRRVYDSRFVDGPLATDFERVVSVADGIDTDTGVVNAFSVVPEGATAIYFNLAITGTTGFGFLQLAPGNATAVTAATINWAESGVTLSNASFSSLDNARQVKILSGGVGSTHFIVDVTGYTI